MRIRNITLVIGLFSILNYAYGQSSFSFQGQLITPGTKAHFKVPISDGEHSTIVPITVFCGLKNGPTLGITAGIHGYEYPPILAGQQLLKRINPKVLSGVVILVQIANLDGFMNRSPFINPKDGKNLNRQFPGDAKGTITERIAAFITDTVIAKSDYFLDMHGGDASEDLLSYTAYYSNDAMPKVSLKGRQMAASLNFDRMVVFNTNGKNYMAKNKPSLYCSAEAFKRGIPSVDIECGGLGKVEERTVENIVEGVINMLQHLNFLNTAEAKTPQQKQLFITDRSYIKSNHDGIFYPTKVSGDYVIKGMKIGEITDYFGTVLETIYANDMGIVLLIIGTPPVHKNETLAVLGRVTEKN